jgi:hypothetical protein
LVEELRVLNATLELRVAERTRELEGVTPNCKRASRRFAQAFNSDL